MKLGPYEIIEPIGAGGMGEVYKARDTRLERVVAIKVLPEEMSRDEERRARFEREAKAVSSLNHPHICTVHDVGREGESDYLVMELLEGESLSSRLERGALPVDEAIRYGIQISDALEQAHRHEIVHRDLKPANVMLTPSGAKLLDFGLAKSQAGAGAGAPEDLTSLPTVQKNLTEEGTILGTFQYMAPEQLEGQAADARTDIFAFGALLFEMLTGRQAFSGKSRMSLIAAILEHEPPAITTLQPLAPPALERVIRTCLNKDPEERWQTAHDLKLQLRWIEEGGSQAGLPAPVVARRKHRERVSWAVAALAITAATVFAGLFWQARSAPREMVRSTLLPPADIELRASDGLAISPGGKLVVFVARDGEQPQRLWLRRLNAMTAQPLNGTENARYPFWSPDSRHIAFFADGKLKKIDAFGGPAQTLCDAPGQNRGGSWSVNGTIVFSADAVIKRVSQSGGESTDVTAARPDSGEDHRYPWFLPGGEHVLFLSQMAEGGTADDQSAIEVLSLENGSRTRLLLANSSTQYTPSGHLLFWREGSLFAQEFDAERLELSGDPFPIAERVTYSPTEYAAFSASRNGKLVLQHGEGFAFATQLVWYDRAGESQGPVGLQRRIAALRLSSDESRIAFDQDGDIWIHDLVRGSTARLSFDKGEEQNPLWSPDDEWIVWAVERGSKRALVRKRASGLGQEETLYETEDSMGVSPHSWSRDGKTLVFVKRSPETNWDIWSLSIENGATEALVETPFIDVHPRLSPDGRWLAYLTLESGQPEIYVQKLTGQGGRWQISTAGGAQPEWNGDGTELFYRQRGTLYAVRIQAGDDLHVGIPEELFTAPFRPGVMPLYDVTGDGQRFLINTVPAMRSTEPLTLIQNWTVLTEQR